MSEERESSAPEERSRLMEMIFREHFSAVQRYILKLVRQEAVADDLTSVVFLKAWRWLREDRGAKQVRSWLYTAARNAVADYWQEQQWHSTLSLEQIEDTATVYYEAHNIYHTYYADHNNEQQQTYLYQLLAALPERERQVLILRYFQGYSAAEAGQRLHLTEGYVRVIQLRALRHAARLASDERKSIPMTETPDRSTINYTPQGQLVLERAKEEAYLLQHNYIGTEHLLSGIISEGSAASSLIEQGATRERVRAELRRLVGDTKQAESNQQNTDGNIALTPRSQQVLVLAQKLAERHAEHAVGPERILQAIINEKQGLAVHILRAIGVTLTDWQAPSLQPAPEQNEAYIRNLESRLAQQPVVAETDIQRLVEIIAQGEEEQRRAELLKIAPDLALIRQSEEAYAQLIPACQYLVLAVAREYFSSTRNAQEIFAAGNAGLSLAAITFGHKRQTTFHTYAAHMIHLQIINALE